MNIQTKINEIRRKQELVNDGVEQSWEDAWCIIPFQVSGIKDYTNQGYVDNQINPEDAETFKRVWTGNDSCVLNWYNSVKLQQNYATKEINLQFKIGNYILGHLVNNSKFTEVGKDVSYTEYTSQQIRDSVTFRVSANFFNITPYHSLMFYKIPKFSKEVVYKLSSVSQELIGKEVKYYVLTFESVNQDFANTGQARQQNINSSAPGQGYMNPKVYSKAEFEQYNPTDYVLMENGEYLTYDLEKKKHRPVVYVVFKAFGVAVPSSVSFIGRPVYRGDTAEKYNYQRLIFPTNFQPAATPTLYRTSHCSQNYYWGEFEPTLEYWKDLISYFKDTILPVNKWAYYGWLMYDNGLMQSNQKMGNQGEGTYKNTLFGSKYSGDSPMKTLQPWLINCATQTVDNTGTPGTEANYIIGGNKTLPNRMWDSFWTQKSMLTLPMNTHNTLSFGSFINGSLAAEAFGFGLFGKKNPWLIGLGAALFVIGLAGGLINKLLPRNSIKYRGFINAGFVDALKGQFSDVISNKNKILMNMLSGDKDNPATIFYDPSTLNTMFQAELTDLFRTTDPEVNEVMSTGCIGQTKYPNGAWIKSNHKPYLVSGREELVVDNNNNKGYIIDQIQVQSIFQGDYSIEFLDANKNIIWSAVYASEGKWTGNIRDIWSVYTTSIFNRENTFIGVSPSYPAALPPLITDTLDTMQTTPTDFYQYQQWHLNKGQTFSTHNYVLNNTSRHEIWTATVRPQNKPDEQDLFVNGQFNANNESILDKYSYISIDFSQDDKVVKNMQIPLSSFINRSSDVSISQEYLWEYDLVCSQFIKRGGISEIHSTGGHGPGGGPTTSYVPISANTLHFSTLIRFGFKLKYYRSLNKITMIITRNEFGDTKILELKGGGIVRGYIIRENYEFSTKLSCSNAVLMLK